MAIYVVTFKFELWFIMLELDLHFKLREELDIDW